MMHAKAVDRNLILTIKPESGESIDTLFASICPTPEQYTALMESVDQVVVYLWQRDDEGLVFNWLRGAKEAGKKVLLVAETTQMATLIRKLGGAEQFCTRYVERQSQQ